ncbi:ras-related and estrogen-regulated growth inhibitor isoform 2-T3 [Glossophaga mutica]
MVMCALVVRFLTKRFIWEYDPTLESTYRHQATIDDEVVTMEILDTAGQEDTIQREGHMRWGEGFVLVYDITDRGSFEEMLPLKNILDEIKKPKNVTLILVGNKADLDHSRQVSTEEGEKLATELACAFYECSACTGEGNITEIFYELCREVRRRRMVQGKTRRRSSTTHVKQAINKMLTKISS